MMNSKIIVLLLSAIFIVYYPGTAEGRASCQIKWSFPSCSCSYVEGKILDQIAKWTSNACVGEKCGYKLVSNTSSEIKATHSTPVKHYLDNLKMDFISGSSGSCTVDGYSESSLWYAVLDSGTNYCNLHNLITGAGLDKQCNFVENTSDADCTQFSSADCEKY